MLSADGKGFIIQKYETLNPTGLTDFMLNEITKEDISYGHQMTKTHEKRKLITGEEIKIKKAFYDIARKSK